MDQTPPLEMDLNDTLAKVLHQISPGDKVVGQVQLGGLPPDEYGNQRFAFYVQGTQAATICNGIIGFLNKAQEGGVANDETF